MNPTLISPIRTLLTNPDRLNRKTLFNVFADRLAPDRPNRKTLFNVFADYQASKVLTCLAPPGSLVQIAAAMNIGWSWACNGWDRRTDELVGLITDPQCPDPSKMLATWRNVPGAVGTLRDRTAPLVAWAQKRLNPAWYPYLATLIGPSNESARLLVRTPSSETIGQTLRRWSMEIDPGDSIAWQEMIESSDLRAALHLKADPSWEFPAWDWNTFVSPDPVLSQIVADLIDGWSPDHPSIQERIRWIEQYVYFDLHVGYLAFLASIGTSDMLVEVVCARIVHELKNSFFIVPAVPWSRLHPRIRSTIDTNMRQLSDNLWKRTWACALGQTPVERATSIDLQLFPWRIAPERWEALDAALRADLITRITFPDHCFGWGVHPDLVAGKSCPNGQEFQYWYPDTPPDNLLAWSYADLLEKQRDHQGARVLTNLLAEIPPERRALFEQIINWRFGGRSEPTAKPPRIQRRF